MLGGGGGGEAGGGCSIQLGGVMRMLILPKLNLQRLNRNILVFFNRINDTIVGYIHTFIIVLLLLILLNDKNN